MLRLYALLLLLPAAACLAADPSCETGVIEGDACCAKSCGACGGVKCSREKGGPASCCRGPIEKSQKYCDENNPPCIIGPTPTPPTPATPSATLTLGGSAIGTVDAKFVSVTFDASAWRKFDLSGSNAARSGGYGATLDVLVQGLHPAHLRVGGTQGDYDVYTGFSQEFPVGAACTTLKPPMTDYRCKEVTVTDFPMLLNFTARNNLSLVYGLSNMYGRPTKTKGDLPLCNGPTGCPPRDQSNIASLFSWLTATQPTGFDHIYAFELGNELNSCLNGEKGAETQANDFIALQKLMEASWTGRGVARSPLLIGPDTHSSAEYSDDGTAWFKRFVETAGSAVAFNTFHMYSLGNGPKLDPNKLVASFLSTESLDNCGKGVKSLQAVLPADRQATLWAGETAAANQGGQSGITDTYIDGFWYLDQLGQMAALNVTVFLRQQMLASSGYPLVEINENGAENGAETETAATGGVLNPLPDYWIARLHKQLMGTTVLGIASSAADIRVYAHCALGSGGVTVAFLNIALKNAVNVTLPEALAAAPAREEFMLTAGTPITGAKNPLQSKTVLLNGTPLQLVPPPRGGGANGGVPSLPVSAGRLVPQKQKADGSPTVVAIPPSTYGFMRFAGASVAACQ